MLAYFWHLEENKQSITLYCVKYRPYSLYSGVVYYNLIWSKFGTDVYLLELRVLPKFENPVMRSCGDMVMVHLVQGRLIIPPFL